MNQNNRREEKEEKKKKPVAWFLNKTSLFIVLGLTVVTVSSLALLAGPSGNSSSSVVGSSLSSSNSSSTSLSGSTGASSTSIPSSSQVQDGPRLSRLNAVGDLTIVISLKNQNFEFFVWSDDEHYSVSVFNGQTLVDTDILGAINTTGFRAQSAVIYGNGILFSSLSPMVPMTYFYSETGTLTTLENHAILDGSDAIREEGIYLVHNQETSKKLVKLISPSLTPVDVNDLPTNDYYVFYDKQWTEDVGRGPIDFSANFRVMQVLTQSFGTKILFFTQSSFTKVLELQLPLMGGELVIHQNGIFYADPMTQQVTYINSVGQETIYTQAMLVNFRDAEAVVISIQSTNTIYGFHKGILRNTYNDKTLIPMATDAAGKYGSSFILSATNGGSYGLYSINYSTGFTQHVVYAEAPPSVNNFDLPTFYKENLVSATTTIGYYNYGWNILEIPGAYGNGVDAFTTIDGVNYAVVLEPIPTATENTFLVKAFDGRQGNNTVYTTTITGVDVLGVDYIGIVNEYLVLTLNDRNTLTGTSFVVDLIGETYYTLPEDIWYMDSAVLTEEGDVIQIYSYAGFVTIDLNDPQGGFFTTSSATLNSTGTVSAGYTDDFFGENDDLVYLVREPFPNPTNLITIEFYRGDRSLGVPSLTLITTYETTSDSIFQGQFSFVGDNIYAYNPWQENSLFTILGDEVPSNYYVQGTALVALDEELNETLIAEDIDAVSAYLF